MIPLSFSSNTVKSYYEQKPLRFCRLTLSWRRSLSYRNQCTDLLCKSMDWFLFDRDLRHERVNSWVLWNYSLLKRFKAFYDSILLYYIEHFRELFYPVFRLLKWETIQDKQFIIIIYLLFVSPKCVARVFDEFPAFHEQIICIIEGLPRIHPTVSVWKEESNRIFLLNLKQNPNLIY